MCGIIGYAGKQKAAPFLFKGLMNLEYRGYDSAGICVIHEGRLTAIKAKGRLENLIKRTDKSLPGNIGIGHTRWATHGEPNEINSHPHFSESGKFAVVHNGIVENYMEIRKFLAGRGFNFVSQTDSEVIAHLLEYYYCGDMLHAVTKMSHRLKGSYALGIVSAYEPDCLYAIKKDSPLIIGIGKEENYIASDMPAIMDDTRTFIILEEEELAKVCSSGVEIYNKNHELIQKNHFFADWENFNAKKENYPHFMLKEIYEQPAALRSTCNATFGDRTITDIIPSDRLKKIKKICILACGSAYHAGMLGKYFIEKITRIPVEIDVASEFRYRDPILGKDTLAVVISQSGETADTLSGLRLAKSKGAFVLSIVNVIGSSIARESDFVLHTLAGPEIAVATTKGYTTQVAVLQQLGIQLAFFKGNLSEQSFHNMQAELLAFPDMAKDFLEKDSRIQQLASAYSQKSNCFFIGRNLDYALAMEAALKYKEISYIHAEAYPAGELKHGTISLIEKGTLVIAISTQKELVEKVVSNVKEVRARGASVLVITCFPSLFSQEADSIIELPAGNLFAPLSAVMASQLLSYYVAANRGCDIDKPRNLAKSVTVE